MSFTHCEADFQASFFTGMAATIMLVNTPSKMPIPRLFWINSTTQNVIGGEKTKIQIKLERKGFTKVKRTKYFLKGRICSHVKTKNFEVCMYGIIWWLLHQQDPKGGVYVPCTLWVSQYSPADFLLTFSLPGTTSSPTQRYTTIPLSRLWLLSLLFVKMNQRICSCLWPLSHVLTVWACFPLSVWQRLHRQSSIFTVPTLTVTRQACRLLSGTQLFLAVPAFFLPGWDSSSVCAFQCCCPLLFHSVIYFILQPSSVKPRSLCCRTNTGDIWLVVQMATLL